MNLKNVNILFLVRYYLDGHIATLRNFTSPAVLDLLVKQIDKVKKICNTYSPKKDIWLSKFFH